MADAAKFCDNCGTATASIMRSEKTVGFLCFRCGSTLRGKKKYCCACGHHVEKDRKRGRPTLLSRLVHSPRVQALAAVALLALVLNPPDWFPNSPTQPRRSQTVPYEMLQADDPYDGVPLTIRSVAGPESEEFKVRLREPNGVAMDAEGNIFVADTLNHRVLKLERGGKVTTFAGSGTVGFEGDGGPAHLAQLDSPTGIAVVHGGGLFIADTGNHRIRRVAPDGSIQTVAGMGSTGKGQGGFSGDGVLATKARLDSPTVLFADSRGDIYFADSGNRRVRVLERGAQKLAKAQP